jgi:hypothetical protein
VEYGECGGYMDTYRDRMVNRVICIITETIPRPVFTKGDVAKQVLTIGDDLTYEEKIQVMAEVCRRYGV